MTALSPVGWWAYEGNTVEQSNNTTNLVHGNPVYVQGEVGQGMYFDGQDDYIKVPAGTMDIGGYGSLAIELWFRTGTTNPQPLLEWNDGTGNIGAELWVGVGGAGRLYMRLYDKGWDFWHPISGKDPELSSADGAVTPDVFHHVGIRRILTAYGPFACDTELWLDGRRIGLVPTQFDLGSGGSIGVHTEYDLYFGFSPSGPYAGARFSGVLDEVTFYTEPSFDFRGFDLAGVYDAGPAGKCPSGGGNPPSIVTQPIPLVVKNGDAATFSLFANGNRPLTYKWQWNGANVQTSSLPGYTIQNVQTNHAGNYRVIVSNAWGMVTSSVASLAVLVSPQITGQPRSLGLLPGDSAQFQVVAVGGNLSYQWRHQNLALDAETDSTLLIPNVQLSDAGGYTVVVSNLNGSVTSAVARLVVGTNGLGADPVQLEQAAQIGGYYAFTNDVVLAVTNTLTIANCDLFLNGAGHAVTLTGSNLNARLFHVAAGLKCSLAGLTIANSGGRVPYSWEQDAAIYNAGGSLHLDDVALRSNRANGALVNDYNGTVEANRCLWESNAVIGSPLVDHGPGATPAYGGAIYNLRGSVILRDCLLRDNAAIGGRGLSVGTSWFWYNGEVGQGGAVLNKGLLLAINCTFDRNQAIGGYNSAGGYGGAVANYGTLLATNCTWYGNLATNDYRADYANRGGAIYSPTGVVTLSSVTFSGNAAAPRISEWNSGVSWPGLGGSLSITGTVVHILNSLVADSLSGSNCFGALIDDGYNLSSDASCGFTNSGSRNNLAIRLAPLADNGGLTPTVLPLPGSPAVDAGSPGGWPTTDQRGVSRPQHGAADIGALEVVPDRDWIARLSASGSSTQTVNIRVLGQPNMVYRLESATSLPAPSWIPVGTNTTDTYGSLNFSVPRQTGSRFFRTVKPQ